MNDLDNLDAFYQKTVHTHSHYCVYNFRGFTDPVENQSLTPEMSLGSGLINSRLTLAINCWWVMDFSNCRIWRKQLQWKHELLGSNYNSQQERHGCVQPEWVPIFPSAGYEVSYSSYYEVLFYGSRALVSWRKSAQNSSFFKTNVCLMVISAKTDPHFSNKERGGGGFCVGRAALSAAPPSLPTRALLTFSNTLHALDFCLPLLGIIAFSWSWCLKILHQFQSFECLVFTHLTHIARHLADLWAIRQSLESFETVWLFGLFVSPSSMFLFNLRQHHLPPSLFFTNLSGLWFLKIMFKSMTWRISQLSNH